MRAPSNSVILGLDHASDDEDPLQFLPEGFLERTKEQGLVVPLWVPQIPILHHSSIGGFLSHCGWNSVIESVQYGVPVIAWPLFAEQRLNAALVTNGLKVALWPKVNENGLVERQEISNVIKKLMEGEEGREIHKRLKFLKDAAANAVKDDELPEEPHRIILHHAKTFVQAWAEELYNINVDRAVCNQTKTSSCGGLLRDHMGKWMCGYMANLGLSNVLTAELWGIYHGLKVAWDRGFKKVIIVESDSSLAVNQILGKFIGGGSVHPITQSIKSLLLCSCEVEIKYIPRSSNMCADGIAKKGLS
ncbi:hydroquinone glucosyltransferase-like [Senna tora]|uniref:Hydroquinone glucosyltransferase-like n=1 Tax=Senna tora TaxID=362788 RepID=A0A834TD70_9FABA|nr:hydroquinone glucosyltransferase-like [Senna tora]